MVETQVQCQKAQSSEKASEEKGKRGRNNRKFQRQGAKKKDPDAVPILQYGPSQNFIKFKEALLKKALQEYGKLGN
jgi:hypothetical protein